MRRTFRFLLSIASERLFPSRRLVGGHAVGKGHWFKFEGEEETTPATVTDQLLSEMKNIIKEDAPIVVSEKPYAEVLEYFQRSSQLFSARLLERRIPIGGLVKVSSLSSGGKEHHRLWRYPLLTSTGALASDTSMSLMPYSLGGFLLVSGGGYDPQPAIAGSIKDQLLWSSRSGFASVSDLCGIPEAAGQQAIFIHNAEMHLESKIGAIASEVAARHAKHKIKVVCIAGPTASGKTTFSHKLSLALRSVGVPSVPLTVDHYYLPLDRQPKYQARKDRGDVDYDSIESMDVELVQQHINELSDGKTVMTPVYNMKTGFRDPPGKELQLPAGGVLIIEGIHALNPEYTSKISAEEKYRIYISPITMLSVDDHNVIKSTQHRLCRRICRDFLFRGNSASKTLSMWPNVRRGEHTWIFPHQNNADFVLNSSMEYELPVLKGRLEGLLRGVRPDDAHFATAQELLAVLDTLPTWSDSSVPVTSLLREFIGGSAFDVH